MIQVELKPLRKNATNAHYVVIELNDSGACTKLTYYDTLREATFHAMQAKNGDILCKGSKALLLFYCKYSGAMRFGFGAKEWERSVILRDLWWANISQASLSK